MAAMKVFLVLLGLSFSSAVIHKECALNNQIKFHKLDISPHPIALPGTLAASVDVEILKEMDNLSLKLTIEKKMGFRWVKMPCIKGVGSCSYPDVCAVLNTAFANGCPPEMAGVDYTCKCPFPPKRFTGESGPIDITDIPAELAPFMNGKYRAKVEVTSGLTMVACHQMEVEFV